MKVIHAENSLDLSVLWQIIWRKYLHAIWRVGLIRSSSIYYQTVSCGLDNLGRDSI